LFATDPQPADVAHVCDDIACRLHDVEAEVAQLQSLGFTVKRSPCLGHCDRGRAALITKAGSDAQRFVDTVGGPAHVGALGAARLVRRIGRVDPASIDAYRQAGGYSALIKALEIGAARIIGEVTAAKLMGRGGAAFPTGRKWDAVRNETVTPHYVVCNADESEPGTFKDRVVMEHDPFAVIEAMTICGFAVGAERGFIYIRGEYPESERAIARAIAKARTAGLLGEGIAGSAFAFDIEIRRGGGAYICGEETALFNSIEGKRGEPRSKPPFPAQFGLFGKPTVVNNVETLVNVLDIINEGGAAWARTGTPGSTGTRLFCLSGHVNKPGLYEIECGRTLREAIELAGGVTDGRTVQAILLGGAAGTFVGPSALDMPLSFEGARAANATLGSGVIMVFDDTADLHDTLARIAEFFRHESCGQCVPCRVGTVRQLELLKEVSAPSAALVMTELGQAMRDASICGLGQTASSAIETAFANVPGLRTRKPHAPSPKPHD
jgi:NADH-quinone oxidoreductase subunit F